MTPSPAPAAPQHVLAYPDTTERRLRRALRQLDAALDEQRRAMADFREQLGTLNGAVVQLGERTRDLRGALGGAAADAARAQASARELMKTADKLESLCRG